MSNVLLRSPGFRRDAKRFLKKKPSAATDLELALFQLSEDPFHASLKTHRLKGVLDGYWSCSVGYDLRIIFSLVRHGNETAILLRAIGTHDEVY